jgi:hypothetical protein
MSGALAAKVLSGIAAAVSPSDEDEKKAPPEFPTAGCVPTGRMHVTKRVMFRNGKPIGESILAASPIYRKVWPERSKYVPHYGKKQAAKDARYAQP